eukprot:86583-Prymnesium_polylepis.2
MLIAVFGGPGAGVSKGAAPPLPHYGSRAAARRGAGQRPAKKILHFRPHHTIILYQNDTTADADVYY